jgi:hypothetical protein
MTYRKADVLAAARKIRPHLEQLVGDQAGEVRAQLDELIAGADRDPKAGTRILALLRKYPQAYQWMRERLNRAQPSRSASRPAAGSTRAAEAGAGDGGGGGEAAQAGAGEKAWAFEYFNGGGSWDAPRGLDAEPDTEPEAESDARRELSLPQVQPSDEEPAGAGATPRPAPSPVAFDPGPGLLSGDTAVRPEPLPPAPPLPEQRFFVAELEGRPAGEPLRKDDPYTIAFSVGPESASALAQSDFPDETLAAADRNVSVFDLTVQLDSEDFEIFGGSTRPLRVPRTGRSLGKARFGIAPRRDGDCELVATVHYNGNFVHQMVLTIPVGGEQLAPVEIVTRGRPPESAAALEPRDISIILEPAPAGGFACTAMGPVAGRAMLPITATELAAAVDAARQAMMSVIQSVAGGNFVFQTRVDIPAEAQDTALRTLARAGSRLFQQLFLHPAAGADARVVGEWLRGFAMNPDLRLTVQVVADHAPLPWAMLYLGDASDGAVLDWNNFLGMRHIVEQLPLQMSLATVDNEILSTPRLSVSVNVNTSIDAAQGVTLVAGHQKYWADAAEAWSGLTLVPRSTTSEVVRALADGHTGDQVVYFYCHATAGDQVNSDPDDAAIIMGTGDSVTVADLNLDAPTTVLLPGSPLVFINACESADLSPLFYNGFVPYFMAKGARGVIGTECKTPMLFAIEWANAFFDRFLEGAPVGETVLDLRQDFLRQHGNPLGLIYAVHCDADTRVAPALARAKARAAQQQT